MAAVKGESPAIGIDLGTTYSCVGVWRNGGVEIIVNRQGSRITPSYVAFTDTDRLVGDAARNQVASNPVNTIFDAKRLIGRRFDDTTLQSDMALWPFKVVPGKEDRPMMVATYKGEEKHFAAEEISAMVLTQMKEIAEDFLGCKVTNAVVTVPAYFTDSQRRATKDAGTVAGLNVLQVINEPTAAALAYTSGIMTDGSIGKRTVLVFDLGGGTFDVSLLDIEKGIVEVKATAGDSHLGGEDFDNRMVAHFIHEFQRKHKKDMSGNPYALRRLKTECEKAKRSLSFQTHTNIFIDSLHEGINFQAGISRAKFEDLNFDLFEKCLGPVEQCLSDAKMAKSGINEVLLVGGSTRIPKVREMLQNFFDGKKPNNFVHPDEVVAFGAAIRAAIIGGNQEQKIHDIVLVDVVSLSLGISVEGGSLSVVVPRNTPIPVVKEAGYTTTIDNQTSVLFEIYEGERVMAKDNHFLGDFTLNDLSPKLAHQAKVNLRFHVDANGMLTLTAHDKDSVGNKASLTITNEKGRLTDNEIAGMVRDAALYKFEDEEIKKKVNAKHELDVLAYSVRNTLRDATVVSKLGYEEKRIAEAAALNAIKWSEEKDASAEAFEFDDMRIELKNLWDPIKFKFNL